MTTPSDPGTTDEDDLREHGEAPVEGSDDRSGREQPREHPEDPAEG